ncbi:MAG: metallophosphoesterase [Acidobacteriota bacterium]
MTLPPSAEQLALRAPAPAGESVRVAVLADIHGNVPALEAVLEDLSRQAVDEVLLGGDLVGRGPEGKRVVERVRQLGWRGVQGNHEEYLLNFRRRRVPEEWLEAEEWSAARWMAAALDGPTESYIDALPFTLTSALAPELRLVHGSPSSFNEGIGPWLSDEQISRHLDQVAEPLLVCAHTHRPMHAVLGGGQVLNIGSVGLPFNRDHRAQYAILTRRAGEWEVDFRRVEYDREAIYRIYRDSGFVEHGGITAKLLLLELEVASPALVPFLQWAEILQRPPREDQLDDFLRFWSPEESMREFIRRLRALG